jgi:1-acyl-sn-glycerol-3-phosphate acyltransferase
MLQWISKLILKLIGWKAEYTKPPAPHGIVIVYPHTSNWDFPKGVLWNYATKAALRWVAKESWFRCPLGPMMRRLGGLGIKRDGNLDITTVLKSSMLQEETCWLCLAPEGTRAYKDYIHMGYYHIAQAANVPIGIGKIDYKTKTVNVTQYRMTMPTIEAELAQLAIDFAGVTPYDPSKASALKLRDKTAQR